MDYGSCYDERRSSWKASSPNRALTAVPLSARTEFFNHYIGPGSPGFKDRPHSSCLEQIKSWQNYHQSKGWKDLGYNAVICQHGKCIEGRGLGFSGSHCPNHNTSGFGVQFMVAGSEVPTDLAYTRMRKLYDDLVKMKGSSLAKKGHRDGISTECPGDTVYSWVARGMPSPGTTITPPKPSSLTVNGVLDKATTIRWQKVMGTPADGVISRPSMLIREVQKFLNARGMKDSRGRTLIVDGLGIMPNTKNDVGPTNTIFALQRYLGTSRDGVLSHPSSEAVKELQRRLNKGKL